MGITDLQMISDTGNSKEEQLANFRHLTSDERVSYVMNQAEYYGFSGDRVKGLIFCSRIDEAKELSIKFNQRGWRTIVLSGENAEEERAEAIERLAGDDCEEALDYIISVDIFSEGVDVVEINQVIMLRPTQSPIVFIQQLGRGLRKADTKEYVVVLDFMTEVITRTQSEDMSWKEAGFFREVLPFILMRSARARFTRRLTDYRHREKC